MPLPAATVRTRCWRCGNLPEGGGPPVPCSRCGAAGEPPRRAPGFVRGVGAAFRGFSFLGTHPSLWPWVVLPLMVNVAVFVGVSWWSWEHARAFVPDLSEPWAWAWLEWLRTALEWILPKLMLLVVVLASFVVTLLVSGVVNAAFYDFLSEKTEVLALGRPELERPWSKLLPDILHSTWAALLVAVRQAIILAALFVLSFTAIGAPIFVIAGFFFTGFALADVPMSRKRYTAGERIRWGRSHFLHLTGVGLPVNVVPLLAPFGIVGATLAFLDQPDKG